MRVVLSPNSQQEKEARCKKLFLKYDRIPQGSLACVKKRASLKSEMFFLRSCKADMLVIQTQTWAVKEKRPANPPLQSYRVFISYLEKDHFYSRPQRTSKHCLLLGRLKLKSELPAAALETKEDKRKKEREKERKKERQMSTNRHLGLLPWSERDRNTRYWLSFVASVPKFIH